MIGHHIPTVSIASWWLNQPIWRIWFGKSDHETPRFGVKIPKKSLQPLLVYDPFEILNLNLEFPRLNDLSNKQSFKPPPSIGCFFSSCLEALFFLSEPGSVSSTEALPQSHPAAAADEGVGA